MGEVPLVELIAGYLFIIALLAAFAAMGTADWLDEQRYKQAWAEANQILEEAEVERF